MFITLEGIEGSGKTSLQKALAERIAGLNREIVLTREPGATWLGEAIRELLLNPENPSLDPLAELSLFAADRAQHISSIIRPALERKAVVICDRYVHSTLAYQGYGRGLKLDTLILLNELITGGLMPDLTLLLDLPVETGLLRAKGRQDEAVEGSSWTRFEQEEIDFHQKVRQGFLALAKDPAQHIAVIDGTKSIKEVADNAWKAVRSRFYN